MLDYFTLFLLLHFSFKIITNMESARPTRNKDDIHTECRLFVYHFRLEPPPPPEPPPNPPPPEPPPRPPREMKDKSK